MIAGQTLGAENQLQNAGISSTGPSLGRKGGLLLNNGDMQLAAVKISGPHKALVNTRHSRLRSPVSGVSSRLEELKKQRFSVEGNQERISRSLAALHEASAIKLSAEEWRSIAEDPDLEDQS